MIKHIRCTLLWAVSCLPIITVPAAYSEIASAQQGINVEYELIPNIPQDFSNHLFWSIDAKCKIFTVDESDDFFAEVLAKKGRLNDIELVNGQCLTMPVHNGEIFTIYAESGAKVRITNLGEHSVKADCKT